MMRGFGRFPLIKSAGWLGPLTWLLGTLALAEIPDTGFEYDGTMIKGSTTRIRDLSTEDGGNTWNNDWQPSEPLINTGRINKVYLPTNPTTLKGDKLAGRYQLEAARAQYEKVLAKDPTNAGALNGLGKIYHQLTTSSNQDLRSQSSALKKDAAAQFIAALRYQPHYVEARVNLANLYLEEGRLRDAHEELVKAMALAPNHSQVLEKMGALQLKKGDVNGAMSYLEHAIQANSANASAHYYLGVAYTLRGENSRALDELQTALYQYPNSAPVHHQMGVVYEQQGNGGAAVNAFKKAITIKPELIPANLSLAEHYRRRGDWSACLETMKNLLESYPEDQTLKFQVADLSMINQEPQWAARQYKEILQSDPDNRRAREGLAQAEERIAKAQASEGTLISKVMAQKTLDSAAQLDPENLDTRLRQVKLAGGVRETSAFPPGEVAAVLNTPGRTPGESLTRGEVLLMNKQFDQARREFNVALNGFKQPADTAKISEMLLDFGMPDEASAGFQKILARHPGDLVARQGLKEALKAKRQSRSLLLEALQAKRDRSPFLAIQLLDQALLVDQTNADAYRQLGVLYEEVKRYDLAVEHYRLYLSLAPTAEDAQSIQRKIVRLNEKLAKG